MSRGPCLGDLVAAVVDGELDHAARERAHRHLAHCPGCRGDVEAQRRLKSRLSGTGPADLSDGLTARLLGLAGPGAPEGLSGQALSGQALSEQALSEPVRPGVRADAARPVGPRSAPVRPAEKVRRGLRGRRRRSSRLGVGSAVAVAGLGVVLALGGPRQATTPVDPANDEFVAEFVSTTRGDAVDATQAGQTGGPRGTR